MGYNVNMLVGTRVLFPEEVNRWDAEFLQITVYRSMKNNIMKMKDCVRLCRKRGIRYVIHPVGYFLQDKAMHEELRLMAELSDLALILHDEKTFEDGRLSGETGTDFRETVRELGSVSRVSFENAVDTSDVRWFWDNFAESITLDIGHVEAVGLDSIDFVKSLDEKTINKIDYVHIHRNNGWHGGLTDHWPLIGDCREIFALETLLKIKTDIGVILEINETEMTGESLELLRELRDKLT